MSFVDEIKRDLIEIERDLGNQEDAGYKTFLWSGGEYPCSYGTLLTAPVMDMGGFTIPTTQIIRVRMKSDPDLDLAIWDFSTTGPVEGDLIVFDSKTYKIESITRGLGQFLVFKLADVST